MSKLSIRQTACYRQRARAVSSKDNKRGFLKGGKTETETELLSEFPTKAVTTCVNYCGAVQTCRDLLFLGLLWSETKMVC